MSNVVKGFNYHSVAGIQNRKKGWRDESVITEEGQIYRVLFKANKSINFAGGDYSRLTRSNAVKLAKQMQVLSPEIKIIRGADTLVIIKDRSVRFDLEGFMK